MENQVWYVTANDHVIYHGDEEVAKDYAGELSAKGQSGIECLTQKEWHSRPSISRQGGNV